MNDDLTPDACPRPTRQNDLNRSDPLPAPVRRAPAPAASPSPAPTSPPRWSTVGGPGGSGGQFRIIKK